MRPEDKEIQTPQEDEWILLIRLIPAMGGAN